VDLHTLFDLASLTKIVGTTTAAMILEEEGLLDLDRMVVSYLPEFDSPDKAPWGTPALAEAIFKVEGKDFSVEFSGSEIEQLVEMFGVTVKWEKVESMTLWNKKLGAYFAAASKSERTNQLG
jgi:hypothetical protein